MVVEEKEEGGLIARPFSFFMLALRPMDAKNPVGPLFGPVASGTWYVLGDIADA